MFYITDLQFSKCLLYIAVLHIQYVLTQFARPSLLCVCDWFTIYEVVDVCLWPLYPVSFEASVLLTRPAGARLSSKIGFLSTVVTLTINKAQYHICSKLFNFLCKNKSHPESLYQATLHVEQRKLNSNTWAFLFTPSTVWAVKSSSDSESHGFNQSLTSGIGTLLKLALHGKFITGVQELFLVSLLSGLQLSHVNTQSCWLQSAS